MPRIKDPNHVINPRRAEANRRNAQKSTGPRSLEGRALSSRNALKHGLTAEKLLLDDEDPSVFASWQERLLDTLRPVGPIEEIIAEKIVSHSWRLRRVPESPRKPAGAPRRPAGGNAAPGLRSVRPDRRSRAPRSSPVAPPSRSTLPEPHPDVVHVTMMLADIVRSAEGGTELTAIRDAYLVRCHQAGEPPLGDDAFAIALRTMCDELSIKVEETDGGVRLLGLGLAA